jgi:CrcB protein
MNKYVYIGIGGFVGASLRYFAGNTISVNIIGCFVLSFLIYSFTIRNKKLFKGLTVGLLGSFTTFSAFAGEIVDYLLTGHLLMFFIYIIFSVVFGLLGAFIGYWLAIILKTSSIREVI